MSRTVREISPELETNQNASPNLQLISTLKKKFEKEKVILFYCECDSAPVDCQCEKIRISVKFNSDLYLPEGILAVRLTGLTQSVL